MLSKVHSAALVGIDSQLVTVEIDIASQGLPSFTIVGLGDRAVTESRERVRSAIRNAGAQFPIKKLTINLAPADLPKEGPSFDLPIALSILSASGQIPAVEDTVVIGELSLDGSVREVTGVLSAVMMAQVHGWKRVIIPRANVEEAALILGIEIYGFQHLTEICDFLNGRIVMKPQPLTKIPLPQPIFDVDIQDIKGQEQAKRALVIAAAGGHNVLLSGPPGAGKTLLARSLPSLLPPLSRQESLEVTKIYSAKGPLPTIKHHRPFRSPHHTSSFYGIVGGGAQAKPGEISLAHRGVLFLDEAAEFPRPVLEALRQPLEDHTITISRALGTLTFPAQFILLAAQNPCPCGYATSSRKQCICSVAQIHAYQKKLSGPILDRIDLFVEVPEVNTKKLIGSPTGDKSSTLRAKVIKARQIQQQRFQGTSILTNSEMTNQQVKDYCRLTAGGVALIREALVTFNLSARGYYRVLKAARTIADLEGAATMTEEHIAEVLQFRAKENPVQL